MIVRHIPFQNILLIVCLTICIIGLFPGSATESSPVIHPILFCETLDDADNPVEPSGLFPSGTSSVLAWFEYRNIPPASSWGYRLTREDEVIQENEYTLWGWDESGSAHRSFTREGGFEDGAYHLTMLVNGKEAGTGSFLIGEEISGFSEEQYESGGSFGRILFAEGATEESAPISERTVFDAGITEIYVIIPFYGMTDGQLWSREWLLDGSVISSTEERWYEGAEGITYRYLYNGDGSPFLPGTYTVNLYLDDQVARSAGFTVTASEKEREEGRSEVKEKTIDELVDPDLMQAYDVLAYSDNEALRILSTLIPDNGITVGFDPDIPGTGQYRFSGPDDPGTIMISPDYYHEVSWEEVAGTIAHELTHALQREAKGGLVTCTVENEYMAFLFEFYALQESGRSDLFYEQFGGAFNSDGSLNTKRLWNAVKNAYSECPET